MSEDSGSLNDISLAIGALRADNSTGKRDRAAMLRAMHEMNKKLEPLPQLVKDVADMKLAVDDWKKTKQRGIGYLAAAGIAGGGASHGITWFLKKLGLL